MSEYLLHYHKVHPATWVYLSSLLMIGLFFKFNRFWSVRNVDLILLILLSPGLLLVHFGQDARQTALKILKENGFKPPSLALIAVAPNADEPTTVSESDVETKKKTPEIEKQEAEYLRAARNERIGYVWLFSVGGVLLIRLLIDSTMVRRPLLEPNLSTGGLFFIGIFLFTFLMANVIASPMTEEDRLAESGAVDLLQNRTTVDASVTLERNGPSYALLSVLRRDVKKWIAIGSHFLVGFGLTLIGYRHFNNLHTGIGIATIYLMLPYTALMTGRVDHVLPAALLVWAVLCYRKPLIAGMFIGLAVGVVYYPIFLLPLWISFYWRRGLVRFLFSVITLLVAMVVVLFVISPDVNSFGERVREMFGVWLPRVRGLEGIWGLGWNPAYRLPILALCVMLSGTLAIWPAQKNLGTLLSCSAAVMLGTQFWHGYGGGLFMAWYLPLMLLTIFRPNLEDRVALVVLREGWFASPRRPVRAAMDKAAAIGSPAIAPRGWWQPSAFAGASPRANGARHPG